MECPSRVYGVAIYLNDLVNVTAYVNSLDGTPNGYEFVGQVYIDFQSALSSAGSN
jgi:hypothetical protein